MNTKEKNVISHANHRQRLYETILQIGLENANDFLTLEFILTYVLPRVDTNPIAHRLLNEFGSISGVLEAPIETLAQIEGMGKNSAKLLSMMPQILLRYSQDRMKHHNILKNKSEMLKYCIALLQNKPNEEVFAICLNASFKVITEKFLAKGEVNKVTLSSKEFLQKILQVPNVEYVVLTHSHPDGSPMPSQEDRASTNTFEKLLNSVQIRLIDHVIVGIKSSYSMKENRIYEN